MACSLCCLGCEPLGRAGWRWQEMASEELKRLRSAMTQEAIREHQMAKTGGTVTDLFQCGKCKKKNCTYNQVSPQPPRRRPCPWRPQPRQCGAVLTAAPAGADAQCRRAHDHLRAVQRVRQPLEGLCRGALGTAPVPSTGAWQSPPGCCQGGLASTPGSASLAVLLMVPGSGAGRNVGQERKL